MCQSGQCTTVNNPTKNGSSLLSGFTSKVLFLLVLNYQVELLLVKPIQKQDVMLESVFINYLRVESSIIH